jgi:hypothetical protein
VRRLLQRKLAAWLLLILMFVILTLLTQIGGVIFIVTLLVACFAFPKSLHGWRRAGLSVIVFVVLYAATAILVVPPIAALAGRIPLACRAEPSRPFAAASPIYCAFNRNYVDARLVPLLTEMSRSIDSAFPGTTTLFLDANFPFLDGFPLLPHLSHGDGRKLDIAYYYVRPDGSYLPGATRSPLGYFAFEQPGPNDTASCPERRWLTLRWNLNALQGLYPRRPMETTRTRAALLWLATEGPKFGVDRIFIEPYLAARIGVSSPLFGFQGCRAARHDDHIHIQIKT